MIWSWYTGCWWVSCYIWYLQRGGYGRAHSPSRPLLAVPNVIIIIITKTMFMVLSSWQSHCESSPGSFDECRMAPSGLGCESAYTGCQKLHPPSPFIIITQPESWYSFYRPTEGRRLSRPSWLVTYRDGLPVHRWSPIRVLTGSDIVQLRWSRPTRNTLPIYGQRTNCLIAVRWSVVLMCL